jgi:hypothetical protein
MNNKAPEVFKTRVTTGNEHTGIFRGDENVLYQNLIVDIYCYVFVKILQKIFL